MVSIAYYGFIIYLIQKHIKNKKIKNILTIVISINIILIGFSRIYLGVHYPTDIIAGFCLGITYLITFINLLSSLYKTKVTCVSSSPNDLITKYLKEPVLVLGL